MKGCRWNLPRPGTIGLGLDGIERAVCWCRRPLVRVTHVPGRQDHWRHTSKEKVAA